MINRRINFLFFSIFASVILIMFRLFWWQVIVADELSAMGENQLNTTVEIHAKRGEILTSDGYPLATNKKSYLIFAYKPELKLSNEGVAEKLSPILSRFMSTPDATESSQAYSTLSPGEAHKILLEKLNRKDILWIPLARSADLKAKNEIDDLAIKGIGAEPSFQRDYPEASMAASLLGFVGSDTAGNPKGYFGLEGYYDLELKGRPGELRHEKDASGKPILIGDFSEIRAKDGRDLVLNIDRAVQNIVEDKLKQGIENYQAASGEVMVMDPKTGAIIAMSSLPAYDPASFRYFSPENYKNPAIAETYEPGSSFKVLVMAAALDTKRVEPETECNICQGPIKIGSYTISTWNDEYRDKPTMTEVIQYSDNVGMVFAGKKLGVDKLYDYLSRFGMGEKTGIDLEEEASSYLRPKSDWREIDLATASFGQGIAVTGIQMVRAVAAIANQGVMMVPQVVSQVRGDQTIEVTNQVERRVITERTARQVTDMMVNAVENGEARWAKPKGLKVAGKTGTAQIPVAGHYDEDKTIASFIGFSPHDDPRFVMLVKLREPQTSPWGSETAAPLWFSIAQELAYYYSIPQSSD